MADEYWKNSPFGERSIFHPSWDEKQKEARDKSNSSKTPINILIVLDASGKRQFDDTKNTIWKVYNILSLADYTTISSLVSKFSFKNFCLVHHGNVYSTVSLPKEEQIVFGTGRIKQMEQIVSAIEDKAFLEMDDEYFELLHEKSKEMFVGGYSVDELKAFCGLRALIGNITSGGNYFSVACDEADDKDFLEKISKYASGNIRLFANSNYSTILHTRSYSYYDKKIAGYGSILNCFLTRPDDWLDNSGWQYYDMAQSKLIVTNKDLWLFSKNKTKLYELVSRKKELTIEQLDKEKWAQRYFSKSFERWYIKNWGQAAYDNFIRGIEAKYPEFKQ